MCVRLNQPKVFRLSLAGVLVAADLVEGHPRYHLHTHVHFPTFGKYAIESYTTSSATSTLWQAMLSTSESW